MVALNRTTVEKEAGPRNRVSPGLVTLMQLLEAPLRLPTALLLAAGVLYREVSVLPVLI